MKGYTVRENLFAFAAKNNGFHDIDHTVWSPTRAVRDGIDVVFWGSPYKGLADRRDGECLYVAAEGADPRTGISGARNIYYPESATSAMHGGSYAVAAKDSGIGLFSIMGNDASNVPYFLQRKRTFSGSPDLFTIYNHFQVAPDVCLPFDGANNLMDVRSGQSITTLLLPEGTQFQQKMGFVLENINDSNGRVEYSCNVGIGGTNEHIDTGKVWSDPNQGGHTVVSGKLLGRGIPTPVKTGGLVPDYNIWVSRANKSITGKASMRSFRFEVSWGVFMETLHHAAIKAGKSRLEMFGPEWNNTASWQLKNVRFAQEFHNPNDLNAELGGALKYFYIKAS